MDRYEELLEYSESLGVAVDEKFPFKGKISGLYVSGNIALSDRLETTAQRSCVLAEELGHHLTSTGIILDLNDPQNQKQENHARLMAYEFMIDTQKLIDAYHAGYQNRFEVAEYLDVTEEFLQEMLDAWTHKYGTGFYMNGYRINLIPNLQIIPQEEYRVNSALFLSNPQDDF